MKVRRSILCIEWGIERQLHEKWDLTLLSVHLCLIISRCDASSLGRVFVKQQLLRAKIIRKYFCERVSSLWGAARFLLAAISRFIGSLKLKIVDGTSSLNSRVFPPRRRRDETGYLQPSFDRGEGTYSRGMSISDHFQNEAAARLRDSRKLSICSRAKAIWTRYSPPPPVPLSSMRLFPFSLAANYGILPGGFLSFLQAFD